MPNQEGISKTVGIAFMAVRSYPGTGVNHVPTFVVSPERRREHPPFPKGDRGGLLQRQIQNPNDKTCEKSEVPMAKSGGDFKNRRDSLYGCPELSRDRGKPCPYVSDISMLFTLNQQGNGIWDCMKGMRLF